MSALPDDFPLTLLDSLRTAVAVAQMLAKVLGPEAEDTRIEITPRGEPGAEPIVLTLADLVRRAETAVAAERLRRANEDVPGEHSPLPWTRSALPGEPLALYDALGTPIFEPAAWGLVPSAEAAANVALVALATSAFPYLVAALKHAGETLAGCAGGEVDAERARAVEAAIAVIVAQVEGR